MPYCEEAPPHALALTTDHWGLLLEWFRQHPRDYPGAARSAGTSVDVATRAWSLGWEGVYPALKEVIEEEQIEARAALEKIKRQKAQEDAGLRLVEARKNAILARAQELQLTQFARGAALLQLHVSTRLADALGSTVEAARKSLLDKATTGVMDVNEYARLARTLAATTRALTESAQMALEMERIVAGEPSRILKVQVGRPRSREELEQEFAAMVAEIGLAQRDPSRSPIVATIEGEPVDDPGLPGLPSNVMPLASTG